MSAKDWVSIVLSMLAFCTSALTAYFNLTERRQVLASAFGTIMPSDETRKLPDTQTVAFTFSNSGNRRVAITGLSLSALQVHEKDRGQEKCEEPVYSDDNDRLEGGVIIWSSFSKDETFQPIILQPGEIVFRRQVFNEDYGNEQALVSAFPGEKSAWVFTCVTFYFLTEDRTSLVEKKIGEFALTVSDLGIGINSTSMQPRTKKLMVLIHDTGLFF